MELSFTIKTIVCKLYILDCLLLTFCLVINGLYCCCKKFFPGRCLWKCKCTFYKNISLMHFAESFFRGIKRKFTKFGFGSCYVPSLLDVICLMTARVFTTRRGGVKVWGSVSLSLLRAPGITLIHG